ncbi:hypothetical protein T08_4193 [Trichinella sp. T8]|nr:hypothetical protein T08_4193 [Trichinella sp. T8]
MPCNLINSELTLNYGAHAWYLFESLEESTRYLGKDATGNLGYTFVSRVDIRVICCSLLECLMCHGWHVDSESIVP